MAFLSLLDIVNQAEAELGLPNSSALAGAASGQPRQMFALANSCGRKLSREHTWGDLRAQASITTIAGRATYSVPSDFSRMLAETAWDTSTKWAISGPITPQLYRALVEGPYGWPSGRVLFAQLGLRNIQVYPTPTTNGLVYDYSYISNQWASSSSGARQTQFLADTDLTLLDADLLVADIKWRWNAAKGLGMAAALKVERDDLLALVIAADLGGRTLDMGETRMGSEVSAVASSTPGNILVSVSDNL